MRRTYGGLGSAGGLCERTEVARDLIERRLLGSPPLVRDRRHIAPSATPRAAGEVMGAIGGPVGAVIGAIAGGAVGALATECVAAGDAVKSRNDRKLDKEIGVSEGELGAPNLEHPPATRGLYSAGAAGVSSEGGEVAEGPILVPPV